MTQVVALLIIPLQKTTDIDPTYVMTYWNIFIFTVTLSLCLYYIRDEIREFFQLKDKQIGTIVMWSVIGVFLVFIAQYASIVIETFLLGIQPGSENTMRLMDTARQAPAFLLIITLLGPILEELVFRKAIFGSLYRKMNFFFAGILSGLIFAALHDDFAHLLTYTAIGLVFAFLYVETKRIIVPIIAHIALNTVAAVAQLSTDPEDIEQILDQFDQLQMILIGGF